MFCGDESLVAHDGLVMQATPLRCKRWSCPECAPRRISRLVSEGRAGLPDTFLTLTVKPVEGQSAEQRARELVHAWRLIRARACKQYGYESVPFLAVFEQTKKGEPHLHVLTRVRWLGQQWLSAQMAELMGAPIVDVRRVRSRAAAVAYVTKYVGKSPHKFDGTKRYWRSQDWFVPNDTARDFITWRPLFWVRSEWSVEDTVTAQIANGWSVYWEHDTAWLEPPPYAGGLDEHVRQWL